MNHRIQEIALGLALGLLIFLAACSSVDPSNDRVARGDLQSEVEQPDFEPAPLLPTEPPAATPVPTAVPTATATATAIPTTAPTSTPIPRDPEATTFLEFAQEFSIESPIVDTALLPGCSPAIDRRTAAVSHIEVSCPEGTPILAGRVGRIVALGQTEPGESLSSAPASRSWSWSDTTRNGDWVVIDHGRTLVGDEYVDVATVLMGLSLAEGLRLGEIVEASSTVGVSGEHPIQWQAWTQNDLFGEAPDDRPRPTAAEAQALAELITPEFHSPIPADCRVSLSVASEIPNAPRPYRNGTHRGTDLGCGFAGHDAYAALDGTVIFAHRTYNDAAPGNRNSVLGVASTVSSTPHWTLNFLYGNYVVVESTIDGHEVLTLYAHLAEVDDSVVVGEPVSGGQRIGVVGNVGTNDSANNITTGVGSVHLHWEIFVDGPWLGQGLGYTDTAAVYNTLFCSPPETVPGC